MANQIRVRILKGMPNFPEGSVQVLEADEHGTPFDQFWRRRLKDAAIDQCCEVVADPAPAAPKTPRVTRRAAIPKEDES